MNVEPQSALILQVYEGTSQAVISVLDFDVKGGFTAHYRKTLMSDLSHSNSMIEWDSPSITPAHDHSCAETTYGIRGKFFSIIDGKKTYYKAGSKARVPVGIIHIVGVDSGEAKALSLNICDGDLTMKRFVELEEENPGGYHKTLFIDLSPSCAITSFAPGSATPFYSMNVRETTYVLEGTVIADINGKGGIYEAGSEIIVVEPNIPRRFLTNSD